MCAIAQLVGFVAWPGIGPGVGPGVAPGFALADPRADLVALRAQDARVAAIAWRLTTANAPLCREIAPQPGLILYDAAMYAPAYRDAARAVFGLDAAAGVTIGAVAPGSAAARAGLAAGDGILAIDGAALRAEPPGRIPTLAGIDRAEAALSTALARGAATLTIARAGATRTVRISADRGCASVVQVEPAGRRNAASDGAIVSVTTAIADATRDDDELAIVIGHELAHNILHHRVRMDEAKVSRGLFAGLGRNGATLRAAEDEADRLGLYLAARAGYDPAAAPRFWSRFGQATDPVIGDGTHPGWRRRVATLTALAARIAADRQAGRPLMPDTPAVPIR